MSIQRAADPPINPHFRAVIYAVASAANCDRAAPLLFASVMMMMVCVRWQRNHLGTLRFMNWQKREIVEKLI